MKFGEWHDGYGAWEVEKGLSAEVFLQHYDCVGGIPVKVWDSIRNQGKKFLSGELAFGMSKSQIIGDAARAIRASGLKLPWNAASWGPTMGRKNEEIILDAEATILSRNFCLWLRPFSGIMDLDDAAFLSSVLKRCSGPGMNSPLTTVSIWDLVRVFWSPDEAVETLYELREEAERLLEPHDLSPMVSALGQYLPLAKEQLALAAQRVADATLAQVAKKKASAAQ